MALALLLCMFEMDWVLRTIHVLEELVRRKSQRFSIGNCLPFNVYLTFLS